MLAQQTRTCLYQVASGRLISELCCTVLSLCYVVRNCFVPRVVVCFVTSLFVTVLVYLCGPSFSCAWLRLLVGCGTVDFWHCLVVCLVLTLFQLVLAKLSNINNSFLFTQTIRQYNRVHRPNKLIFRSQNRSVLLSWERNQVSQSEISESFAVWRCEESENWYVLVCWCCIVIGAVVFVCEGIWLDCVTVMTIAKV